MQLMPRETIFMPLGWQKLIILVMLKRIMIWGRSYSTGRIVYWNNCFGKHLAIIFKVYLIIILLHKYLRETLEYVHQETCSKIISAPLNNTGSNRKAQ